MSDSVFSKSVLGSEATGPATSPSKNDSLENRQAFTENQASPTTVMASSTENMSEARLTQIEDENKYLKSERDRILREYSDYQKNNKPKRQKPQYIENTKTTQKEKTNTVSNQEDPQRRRRWWWPFAAAGGVATVMVLSDNGESEDVPVDSAAVALAFLQSEAAAVAFSSAVIGVDLRERPDKGDSGLMALEIPIDSISKEEQPKVQLFSFKEIVYFKLNQKIPDAVETEKLTHLGEFTKNNKEYRLVITGFADNTGNVYFNLRLAEERMNSVADFLKKEFGLEDDQLRLETGRQVIRGSRQAANELDRRVEVRIESK